MRRLASPVFSATAAGQQSRTRPSVAWVAFLLPGSPARDEENLSLACPIYLSFSPPKKEGSFLFSAPPPRRKARLNYWVTAGRKGQNSFMGVGSGKKALGFGGSEALD